MSFDAGGDRIEIFVRLWGAEVGVVAGDGEFGGLESEAGALLLLGGAFEGGSLEIASERGKIFGGVWKLFRDFTNNLGINIGEEGA